MIIEKYLSQCARCSWFGKNNVIESAIKWLTQLFLFLVIKLLLTTGHIVVDIFLFLFLWMWLESNHSARSNEANARHYYKSGNKSYFSCGKWSFSERRVMDCQDKQIQPHFFLHSLPLLPAPLLLLLASRSDSSLLASLCLRVLMCLILFADVTVNCNIK